MPNVKCKLCKKEFHVKPSWLKYGNGKYCSSKCQYEGRKNGINVKCFICSKEVYKPKGILEKSKSKKYFCSKSCQTKWRNTEFIGTKHANWINGESTYRNILERADIKKLCYRCGNKDKRILAVHHIDLNHKNNRLENLAWLCHNCHHLVHHYKNERDKFMVAIV